MRSTILAILLLITAFPARAQEKMSRADTAAILFSNRFSFTDEGEPVLPVRIMDDQERIELSTKEGILFHPSGPGGPGVAVSGSSHWTVTVTDARPARLGYRAVLATVPTKEFQEVRRLATLWQERGVETTRLELGTLFSFQGTVFDSRETLICATRDFARRGEARSFLDKLAATQPGSYRVVEVLAERPAGTITVAQRGTKLTLTARNAIWFEPTGDGSLAVRDVEYARGFPWHGRQNRSYAGSFYVAVDKYGHLAIVNVLPAEKLLKGLVPAEIYPDSPDAALEAQAISARNEMFSKIGHRHLADPYLVCADQHCQVYKGLNAERSRASRAVERTRGEVIFDEDGKLADIRYHSTCGGHTEDGHEAWPGVTSPNLKGRFDARREDGLQPLQDADVERFLAHPPESYCGRSAKAKNTFRWEKSLSAAELTDMVNKKFRVGKVTALKVLHRGVSGRVNKLQLVGSRKSLEVDGELVIRRLFGSLKSSLFVIRTEVEGGTVTRWTFSGGGFGHGVGMCQIGAMEMAKEGRSAKEILEFYYRNITMERIY